MSLLVIDFHNELVQLVVGSNSMTAHAGHSGCAQYKFYNQVLSKGHSTAYGRERESNMSTKKLPFVCRIRSFKTNKTNKLTFKDLLSTSCFKLSELE